MTNQQAGFWILMIGMLFCLSALGILIWNRKRRERYTEKTEGIVVGHRWFHQESLSYPCALVEYQVGEERYRCTQSYAMVYSNSIKKAEYDWEIDEDDCLHIYSTSRCKIHVNPIKDWFPIGSRMEVFYVPGKPRKAYCGSLKNMKLLWIILGAAGLGIGSLGILLMTILK